MTATMINGSPPNPSGETLRFMKDIWALSHELEVASRRMQQALGVTGPQRLVVRMIGQIPGIAPRDIAAMLDLHPSTLTGVLSRLEAQRFIERRPDPEDRRRLRCFLTTAGRRVDGLRRGTIEAAVRRALGRVSPATLDHTTTMIRLLVAELQRLG